MPSVEADAVRGMTRGFYQFPVGKIGYLLAFIQYAFSLVTRGEKSS